MAAPLPIEDHPARLSIVEWGEHLQRDRRRSAHTVRAYVATGHRFVRFLGMHLGQQVDVTALRAVAIADLRAYLTVRRGEGLTNTSAARELSALRGFLSFVAAGGDIPKIRGPRVKRGIPRPIAPADAIELAQEVSDASETPWIAARDLAVLLLLYVTGLRIGEAMGLTGAILPLGETIVVVGKRSKARVVPLIAPVRQALNDYVAQAPFDFGKADPLFRGARGGPLSADIIRRAVRGARIKLGLTDRTTPHALRHSFASHLLGRGADLRSLQELLGHASLSSTQVYTGVDAAHLLDVYRHAHPRAS